MKHYDYIEWMLYKNEMLTFEKSKKMEEHLYNCNLCMEIFLSLINEKEEEGVSKFISDDFTSKVISNMPNYHHKEKKKQKNKKLKSIFNYQFGYYVAAASITIILTVSGLYLDLVDAVPKISSYIDMGENSNKIVNFSSGIVDTTSNFLSNIENGNMNCRREKDEK